jgi:NAD(P)-dependent dehydrogenase (short-subunit alcohol dehydrogenase family)
MVSFARWLAMSGIVRQQGRDAAAMMRGYASNCGRPAMDLELKAKRALVTGGSRGIGKAIARVLAQEGADVALLARNAQALAAAAAEVAAESGRSVVGVRADTTRDDQVRAAVAEAVRLLGGPIDILVNAAAEPAGFAGPPKLAEITGEYFHAEMDTKVMGYLRCAREVAPGMQARGWGRIVNISGLAARQTGNAVGSMRNVAVAALAKNLADELGPHGINVTVVHPGTTRTERTAPLVAARAAAQSVPLQAVEAQMAAANSINHLVDATEVAQVVAFLCSPKSRAINGDAIAVGGGAPRSIHY